MAITLVSVVTATAALAVEATVINVVGTNSDYFLVGVSTQSNTATAITVTNISWNGTSTGWAQVTNSRNTHSGGERACEFWWLAAPAAVTANLRVATDLTFEGAMVGVFILSGVHQTTPHDDVGGANGTSATATVTVTLTQNGGMVVDTLYYDDSAATPAAAGGQTQDYITKIAPGDVRYGGGSHKAANTGTATMSWALTNSDNWVQSVVALFAATAGGTTGTGSMAISVAFAGTGSSAGGSGSASAGAAAFAGTGAVIQPTSGTGAMSLAQIQYAFGDIFALNQIAMSATGQQGFSGTGSIAILVGMSGGQGFFGPGASTLSLTFAGTGSVHGGSGALLPSPVALSGTGTITQAEVAVGSIAVGGAASGRRGKYRTRFGRSEWEEERAKVEEIFEAHVEDKPPRIGKPKKWEPVEVSPFPQFTARKPAPSDLYALQKLLAMPTPDDDDDEEALLLMLENL